MRVFVPREQTTGNSFPFSCTRRLSPAHTFHLYGHIALVTNIPLPTYRNQCALSLNSLIAHVEHGLLSLKYDNGARFDFYALRVCLFLSLSHRTKRFRSRLSRDSVAIEANEERVNTATSRSRGQTRSVRAKQPKCVAVQDRVEAKVNSFLRSGNDSVHFASEFR